MAMSPAEILAEVVERPRRAYVPLEELSVIERPGWHQLINPSFKQGGFNEVSFSALDEGEADATIDATIAQYRANGSKFRWRVGPGSAPADLGARLARRGLVHGVSLGMARSTELPPVAAPAIRIVEVDRESVGEYTRVVAEGWGDDPSSLARANHAVVDQPDGQHHLFLAYLDGVPAAGAGSVEFPRSVYLLGGVVLPAFRRRGLYAALVRARLARAAARGIPLATSHALQGTSAPILERMGFETICRFDVYSG